MSLRYPSHEKARPLVTGGRTLPTPSVRRFRGHRRRAAQRRWRCGSLIRAMDWSQMQSVQIESSSRAAHDGPLLLANRFPAAAVVGADYISIYNDAYQPHPRGQASRGPGQARCGSAGARTGTFSGRSSTRRSMAGRRPGTKTSSLQELNRHGFLEETHFTDRVQPGARRGAPAGSAACWHRHRNHREGRWASAAWSRFAISARAWADAKTAEEACVIAADNAGSACQGCPVRAASI